MLDELGRYIIQDGEAGVAVYRIAHQTLADHIRPPFAATHQQVFDPQAQPVAAALLGRYAELLASGVPVTGPGYLWRYAWRHAAAAGPAGLELIREPGRWRVPSCCQMSPWPTRKWRAVSRAGVTGWRRSPRPRKPSGCTGSWPRPTPPSCPTSPAR